MLISTTDWTDVSSILPEAEKCAKNYANFGIHEYNSSLWTAGYVGINWLRSPSGTSICREGDDIALKVTPRFGVDPWKMLNAVIKDDEYYLYTSGQNNKPLFEIFTNSRPIECEISDAGGEVLLAISYIKECEHICRKQLKTHMSFRDENLYGKVKGKILFNKHIRENAAKGREDRIYCRFSVFSIDTPENRILKAALIKAEQLLQRLGMTLTNLRPVIRYCKKALENVRNVQLSSSMLASAKTTGMYAYYRQAIRLSELIYKHHTISVSEAPAQKARVVPFVINMEQLFEYYVRVLIKEYIKSDSSYQLERYSEKFSLLKSGSNRSYLINNCIPDIVLLKNSAPVAVFDVKYKDHKRSDRDDSHQLMSYALLLNVKCCGYVFPKGKADCLPNRRILEDIINSQRDISVKYEEYLVSS